MRLARWHDWIQFKLPFLTALIVLLAPAAATAPRVLAIVMTVTAGAAFGYALNEVADRASDAGGEIRRPTREGPTQRRP